MQEKQIGTPLAAIQGVNTTVPTQSVYQSLPILANQFLRIGVFSNLLEAGACTVRIGIYAKYARSEREVQESQVFEKGFQDIPVSNLVNSVFVNIPVYYGNLYSVTAEILPASVAPGGSIIQRGEVFVTVGLFDGPQTGGALLIHKLLSSYVTPNNGASWPAGTPDSPEDAARIAPVIVLAPGAGNEWTQAVPLNTKWKVISAKFLFVTAVGGGARIPMVGGNNVAVPINPFAAYGGNMDFAQPAATNALYFFDINSHPTTRPLSTPAGFVGTILFGRLSGELWLNAGDSIGTVTENLAAGDVYSQIRLVVKQSIIPT